MAFKMFVSNHTHRTEAQQLATLAQKPELANAPVYTQDDISNILRPTTRRTSDTYVAASVACFEKREVDLRVFLAGCRKKKIHLASVEEEFHWSPTQSPLTAIKAWKAARVNGAAKIGGRMSADLREAKSRKACAKIKDRWPEPSKTWPTDTLLREAGAEVGKKRLAYNTAIKFLGKRPIVQYNHQAKLKRKARQNG